MKKLLVFILSLVIDFALYLLIGKLAKMSFIPKLLTAIIWLPLISVILYDLFLDRDRFDNDTPSDVANF